MAAVVLALNNSPSTPTAMVSETNTEEDVRSGQVEDGGSDL
jgi:hypothetical protein